jgi:biopolymer transport protein ExbD
MPIVVPGRRLGIAYAGGAGAAKKKLKRGKRSTNAPLMLTPMVDMFVILVLYLIQQFSASGQLLFIDPTMKLPEARRAVDMAGNPPIITIAKDMISVQGKPAEATDQLIKDGYWAAPKLEEKLKEMRDLSTRVSNATGGQITTESAQGVIVVQADVGVPYMLVKKVLFTANKVGFTQVNFAVTRGGLSAEEIAKATEAALGGGEAH